MKTLAVIFSVIILSLGISACGYDGHYRYPCQDPANFGTKECIPPLCEVTGQCTIDLLGFDPTAEKKISQDITEDITSDIIEEEQNAPEQENVDNINKMVDEMSEGN